MGTSSRKPMTASNRKRLQTEREKELGEKKRNKDQGQVEESQGEESQHDENQEKESVGEESEGSESVGEVSEGSESVGEESEGKESEGEESNDDEDSADEDHDKQDEVSTGDGSDDEEEQNKPEEEEPTAEKDVHTNVEDQQLVDEANVDEEILPLVIQEKPVSRQKKSRKRKKDQPVQTQEDDEDQPSLLFAYKDHIAHKIWHSKATMGEGRIVKIHTHVGTQRLWELDGECQFVKDVVMGSGFYQLILHVHDKLDKVLINAFIERFYPETNTFHLPFGEMMITIDEVVHITGLPAEGHAVTGSMGGSRHWEGKKIRLEWLRSKFAGSKDSDTQERKNRCATAYLLYTIGCIVCGDKSGNKVGVHFLQSLGDLNQVHTYSWATACLSWLVYNLGQTTRKDVQQISRCMTLLQVWIFEHFPVLRCHKHCVGAQEGDVRASFYFAMDQGTKLTSELITLRERIDDLQSSDVVWDPYKDKRDSYKFQQCALYNGPIVCFDCVELYLPQRTLRQFGYVQPIPTASFTLDKKRSKSTNRLFKAIYQHIGDLLWSEWSNHLLSESLTSNVAANPTDCADNYEQWYRTASHPLVANPSKRITTPVSSSHTIAELIRIKRRLRHLADFVKSCPPSTYRNQIMEKVKHIDDPEPSHLYGETMTVEKDVGSSKQPAKTTGRGGSKQQSKAFAPKKSNTGREKRAGRKK